MRYFCIMIDLARHIETLLLENDCVILPDLGGFVAHYNAATYIEEEHTFLPPTRTIGFNPQLKMNDGVLVQSYMSVYGTNFSDATRMVNKKIQELIASLHENGKVVLPNVGEIRYTIHGTYDFVPYDNQVTTPSLYGLDSFEMKPLAELQRKEDRKPAAGMPHRMPTVTTTVAKPQRRLRTFRLNRTYLTNAVAMIAAVILFFLFSTPIENTEVVQGNYARLLPEELFEQIGKSSLAVTPVQQPEAAPQKTVSAQAQRRPATTENKAKHVKPIVMREVKVKDLATDKTETKQEQTAAQPVAAPVAKAAKKPYHIIVASVATEKDAQAMASQLKEKGYAGASAIIGNGKMRVSIESFATQAEAYQSLQTIRQNKNYESAWVLKY